MRRTLIALLLAGVAGCDLTPEEPVSEFDAARQAAEQRDAEAQNNRRGMAFTETPRFLTGLLRSTR